MPGAMLDPGIQSFTPLVPLRRLSRSLT